MTTTIFPAPFPAWIALDTDDFSKCLKLVEILHPHVVGFKVHAFAEEELSSKVGAIKRRGADRIWWDRKAKDTPDTVAAIATVAKRLGIVRLTVHAAGGIEMMAAAVAHGPKEIVAITDLTSLTRAEIGLLGGMPTESSTLLKAQWAKLAFVTHLVCSCEEVGMLNERRHYSDIAGRYLELHDMKFVVPGSRTIPGSSMNSQRRSTTALEAIGNGADELVIGSEVWKATDPLAALMQIYERVATSNGQ